LHFINAMLQDIADADYTNKVFTGVSNGEVAHTLLGHHPGDISER
jgi:hypothetical protein